MRIISYIFIILLILLGLSFAALNSKPVSFNYYLGAREVSLSLILIYSLGIGIILGLLTAIIPLIKLKTENRRLRHKLKQIEKQVQELHPTMPQ